MSDTDDPFGEPGDLERTVIRPNPGGRRRQGGDASTPPPADPATAPGPAAGPAPSGPAARPSVPPPAAGDGALAPEMVHRTENPLLAAATPLLNLIGRLKTAPTHADPDGLRERVIQEIRAFERRLQGSDLAPELLRAAHYGLCATVDDVVLNTPWGGGSSWSTRGMVLTFHNEAYGGKRFFTLLERLERNPGRSLPVLEVYYACLALGFEGEMRVLPNGGAERSRIVEGLYGTLRGQRAAEDAALSPHWRGVAAAHRPLASFVPLWVIGVATLALLTLGFAGFSWAVNRHADAAFARLGDLPPSGEVTLVRADPTPPPPPPPPPQIGPDQLERITTFLQPEIEEGLVTVFDDATSITVRIRNTGMFGSGSASVEPSFTPVLDRVAAALAEEPGPIVIEGHTDSIPIRTLRFPSNWHLSVARAEAVQAIIAPALDDPSRITVEGMAANEPIASNDTPEGREQNRRIEIVLMKQAG